MEFINRGIIFLTMLQQARNMKQISFQNPGQKLFVPELHLWSRTGLDSCIYKYIQALTLITLLPLISLNNYFNVTSFFTGHLVNSSFSIDNLICRIILHLIFISFNLINDLLRCFTKSFNLMEKTSAPSFLQFCLKVKQC